MDKLAVICVLMFSVVSCAEDKPHDDAQLEGVVDSVVEPVVPVYVNSKAMLLPINHSGGRDLMFDSESKKITYRVPDSCNLQFHEGESITNANNENLAIHFGGAEVIDMKERNSRLFIRSNDKSERYQTFADYQVLLDKTIYAMPVYVENTSTEIIKLNVYVQSLMIIQEAKNQDGEWQPIEWWGRGGSGTPFRNFILSPGKGIVTEIIKYTGEFETEIRVKLKSHDAVIYSEPFDGNINLSQFNLPDYIDTSGFSYSFLD